ncbi:MAG TPA: penicillin-binding transpeptidase domain-containing protein [Blastocatellia bacterium]|jgi:cell division protein FtsI/penicillin-binding protein 2|nr:penicillin-binding transpeptidase domain-containing protein [Blastocatellia bacterium]
MNFPFIATLAFLAGLAALICALFLSAWRYRPRAAEPAADVPADFGPRLTSVRLRYVRWIFAALVIGALGFHAYWALFAAGPLGENPGFALLKNKRDQRNRREAESQLRGWVFDRHRDIRRALAKYRYLNGQVIRDYPLGPAAAHLIGYTGLQRGDAMLERALDSAPPREPERAWWERLLRPQSREQREAVGRDLAVTVDYELQQAAAQQLAGRRGAVVMINPQTGEVLALASAPSFDPDDINNDVRWQEITRDVKNRPLLNRALDEYYLPGSTLKTLTAAAALDARLDDQTFFCQGAGWTPPGSNRPIRDDEGEAHGRIALHDAYTHSCNQYFAQLGVAVERERMAEAARRFGLRVFETGPASLNAGPSRNLWNTENALLSDVFAPLSSTFVASRRISKYDLALESIGQGFVQLTPFQMAMIAGAVANTQGMVMRPKLELDRAPAALSQAMSPQASARVREFMASVVKGGTARGPFAAIIQGKTTAGGKTGTAQREVPVIDQRTGKPAVYRDGRGRERVRREHRIDSWFIGFAPVENPQIAFAVVVEGGGYGSRTSAPIAANLLVKAQALGLLNPPPAQVASRQK